MALAGTSALAGCTSDAAESDKADDTDGESADGADRDADGSGDADETDGGDGGPCDGLTGDFVAFDQGDRSFPILFDHPDTLEQYNEELNEGGNIVGAQLGHVASKRPTSYPVNLLVQQHKSPITDEEAATNWVTFHGQNERLDRSLAYEGEQIALYQSTYSEETARQWRFLLPAHDGDGVRGVVVQHHDDRKEGCIDGVEAIAVDVIESMRPNPKY
ncbi:hypothetical protein [Halosolutus gelatinilyticus]|uniref:hypothetical protein n=1 Tax=Halosolutus gelatinilyticus TaxID=2931975 RepID=UPI001FF18DB5|nr:hypothetical protein [Halosolutus gelatinilyticus]